MDELAIFRGIGLNPLAPGNVSYLLWMLMGYLVVTAVLVLPLGRLGDIFGRVRIYNLGFAIFTIAAGGLATAAVRPADVRTVRSLGSSGVWEIFLPGLGTGALYGQATALFDWGWHLLV